MTSKLQDPKNPGFGKLHVLLVSDYPMIYKHFATGNVLHIKGATNGFTLLSQC